HLAPARHHRAERDEPRDRPHHRRHRGAVRLRRAQRHLPEVVCVKPVFLALALCAGCALPVVSAGTFLPAGDLQKGQVQASLSMEVGRVLAGPSDVPSNAVAPDTSKWEVLTWVASDASIRWQVLYHLTLEAQLKLTNPIAPFVPNVAGAALGARLRLYD